MEMRRIQAHEYLRSISGLRVWQGKCGFDEKQHWNRGMEDPFHAWGVVLAL